MLASTPTLPRRSCAVSRSSFERLQRVQGRLEVAHATGRFGLLQPYVPGGAFARAFHAERHERCARGRHDLGLELRPVGRIRVELAQYHRFEMAPFARGLADVISLLPPMHAVLGSITPLLAIGLRNIMRLLRPQARGEIINDAGNVIVERAA